MKKFTFVLFLTISFNGIAMGFECPTGATVTEQSCNSTAGCVFKAGSCQKCDNGEYRPGNDNKCYACDRPDGADPTGPGTSKNTCPWTLTCDANTYWDDTKCTPCATNQESTSQEIKYNGDGSWPAANTTHCKYKAVRINLEKNQGKFDIDKTIYAKCNEGFADKPTGPWREQPNITPTLWWGQAFIGYFNEKNGGQMRINSEGRLPFGITACSFTDDPTTLYGQWNNLPYNIEYYYDSEMVSTQNCYLDTECKAGNGVPSKTPAGKYLKSWKCQANCSGNIEITADIPQPAAEGTEKPVIKLVAIFDECPKGYYCTTGSKTPCPMGSTSKPGTTAIADCFIQSNGGKTYSSAEECVKENATCFCDDYGCFTLPGTDKINYSSGS